jgi:signal transduction histidine kinase
VVIDVADQGIGISPDKIPHIFEPFFSTKGSEKGVGLGLSVLYGIVKEHGGDIYVKSKPGMGSVFSVFLPLESAKIWRNDSKNG